MDYNNNQEYNNQDFDIQGLNNYQDLLSNWHINEFKKSKREIFINNLEVFKKYFKYYDDEY